MFKWDIRRNTRFYISFTDISFTENGGCSRSLILYPPRISTTIFFWLTLTPACLFLISVPTVVFCMVSRSSVSVLYPQLGHCTSITLISFILSGLSVSTTSVRFPWLSRQASIRRFRRKPEVAGKRGLRALRPSRRNICCRKSFK